MKNVPADDPRVKLVLHMVKVSYGSWRARRWLRLRREQVQCALDIEHAIFPRPLRHRLISCGARLCHADWRHFQKERKAYVRLMAVAIQGVKCAEQSWVSEELRKQAVALLETARQCDPRLFKRLKTMPGMSASMRRPFGSGESGE